MIPPHDTYIESHLGSGVVLRNKVGVQRSIGIDADARVIAAFPAMAGLTLVHGDAIRFLRSYPFTGDEVVYCDPPYLPSTRRRKRVYAHDYTQKDHEELLDCLLSINAKVLLSGYPSALYDRHLRKWSVHSMMGVSQIGRREERLWLNFTPLQLSDYRYLGTDFHDRQRLRRRSERWIAKLRALPLLERQALLLQFLDEARDDPHLSAVLTRHPHATRVCATST